MRKTSCGGRPIGGFEAIFTKAAICSIWTNGIEEALGLSVGVPGTRLDRLNSIYYYTFESKVWGEGGRLSIPTEYHTIL